MPSSHAEVAPKLLDLASPVQYLKGIGPKRAEQLASHGIHTAADLLDYLPFRYEDRSEFRTLKSLGEGEWVLTRGEIWSLGNFEARRGRFSVFQMVVRDATASVVVKFFNQPYLRTVYSQGTKLIIYGQVLRDQYHPGSLCFQNPECEILENESGPSIHTGRIVPIYRKLGDIRTRWLRQIMYSVLSQLPAEIEDPLPSYLRKQFRLGPRAEALRRVHFPSLRSTTPEGRAREFDTINRMVSLPHKRLIFEELFQLQVGIYMVREHRLRLVKDRKIRIGEGVRTGIKKILPFHPTAAQKRVLKEIADDMCSARPMSRLLQGDVGSGKTIVAAQAAIIAVENGFQVALMAPTEILAEQHYFNFTRVLGPLQYKVGLVKRVLSARQKRETLDGIRRGDLQIAIGTHALIQDTVEFHNLGLAIIDEQHRFGVRQRNVLKEKGGQPDILVMTATPIPRSLALTIYGDLDLSVIDEMPPGRSPIETLWLHERDRMKAYDAMRRTIAAGQQVYIVYPLVEKSEKSDLKAATAMAEHLRQRIFPDISIGLLHGRMKSEEKERVMAAFVKGEISILVSTTVIEVGVDVANASLMVIEHAERFGLSQLHQLRGRVGRGVARSRCILLADVRNNPEAQRRLEIMTATNDGFRIAEVDLELRGPGEMAGTRQSGVPMFKHANLVRDRKALEVARSEAGRFLGFVRNRPNEEIRRIAETIRRQWRQRYGLLLVG